MCKVHTHLCKGLLSSSSVYLQAPTSFDVLEVVPSENKEFFSISVIGEKYVVQAFKYTDASISLPHACF